ncbi:MAG: hypothetical protein LBI67_00560 [Treponema sp.]|jgi:hypothetical protein|nr:hypothetical protein [Treponema sp.]
MVERQNSVLKSRRAIRELDEKRREFLRFRDKTLENLGESLFRRLTDGAFPDEESGYRRFRQEIADSEQAIAAIKDALAGIRLLNEEINIKKEEQLDRKEEREILLTALGKELFSGSYELPDSLLSGKRQIALYLSRKASIEEQIRTAEDSGQTGIFNRISGVIKTAILRSQEKKCETLLNRIRCESAAKYLAEKKDESGEFPVLGPLVRDALALSRVKSELEEALRTLEGEKRKIEASLGFKGSPSRRIRALEEQAEKSREALAGLFLKMGENAAANHPSLSGILNEQDKAALEEADRLRKNADEKTREIERIETAISMDRETAELSKLEKALEREKGKVADEERNMAELGRKISETRSKIERLKAKDTQ